MIAQKPIQKSAVKGKVFLIALCMAILYVSFASADTELTTCRTDINGVQNETYYLTQNLTCTNSATQIELDRALNVTIDCRGYSMTILNTSTALYLIESKADSGDYLRNFTLKNCVINALRPLSVSPIYIPTASASYDINFINNTFTTAQDQTIQFNEGGQVFTDISIINNTFYRLDELGSHIRMDGMEGNEIVNLYGNNFYNTTTNLISGSPSNPINATNNLTKGNYYSAFSCTDTDYDGLCDTPINTAFLIDDYPLLNPAPYNNCISNWVCSAYDVCLENDTKVCLAVTDVNACGYTYIGNLSEIPDGSCDFSPFEYSEGDISKATIDTMVKFFIDVGALIVILILGIFMIWVASKFKN